MALGAVRRTPNGLPRHRLALVGFWLGLGWIPGGGWPKFFGGVGLPSHFHLLRLAGKLILLTFPIVFVCVSCKIVIL